MSVICAETLLTGAVAVVEHNLPVAFWTQKIAQKFSYACTKATSITDFMTDSCALTDF